MSLTISGAYGRDYKSKAAIVADLKAGKDFVTRPQGRLINLPQLNDVAFPSVTVRYAADRKVCILKLSDLNKE